MLPLVVLAVGGYLVYDSLKNPVKKMATGGKISGKLTQMLDAGFEFVIWLDVPRTYGQYHILIKKEKGNIAYILKKGHVSDSKKVKSFTNEKDAIDYLSNSLGVKVTKSKGDYADGGMMADGGETKNKVYVDGIGWCKEVTHYRSNEDGIREPYVTYELITNSGMMAKGGKLKVGDKFGDYSVTLYEPITYDDLGSSFGGKVKLVNQVDFDTLLIQYDNALRSGEWFTSKDRTRYVGKNPHQVILKMNLNKMADGDMMAKGGSVDKIKFIYSIHKKDEYGDIIPNSAKKMSVIRANQSTAKEVVYKKYPSKDYFVELEDSYAV